MEKADCITHEGWSSASATAALIVSKMKRQRHYAQENFIFEKYKEYIKHSVKTG